MKETQRLYDELKLWIEAYGESSIELVKLKSTQASAKAAGSASLIAVLLILFLFFLLMLSVGVALWLGQVLENHFLGFFAVSGFYLLIAVLVIVFKDTLVMRPIQNLIIRLMLKSQKL